MRVRDMPEQQRKKVMALLNEGGERDARTDDEKEWLQKIVERHPIAEGWSYQRAAFAACQGGWLPLPPDSCEEEEREKTMKKIEEMGGSDERVRAIVKAIREAQKWTGWDWNEAWRYNAVGEGDAIGERDEIVTDQPLTDEDRPDNIDDDEWARLMRETAEYGDHAEGVAVAASDEGDKAIEALRVGDYESAQRHIDDAETYEYEYGDAPSWRPVAIELKKLIEMLESD